MDENTPLVSPQAQNSGANLLSSLLSNPGLMEKMQSILSSAVLNAEKAEPVSTVSDSASAPIEAQPLSGSTGSLATNDGLSKILSDPTLLAKLPQILATVKPLLSTLSVPAATTPNKENAPKSLPVCRDNLLLALKPFLSHERCQAIDSMLRIAKLGEILGQLK